MNTTLPGDICAKRCSGTIADRNMTSSVIGPYIKYKHQIRSIASWKPWLSWIQKYRTAGRRQKKYIQQHNSSSQSNRWDSRTIYWHETRFAIHLRQYLVRKEDPGTEWLWVTDFGEYLPDRSATNPLSSDLLRARSYPPRQLAITQSVKKRRRNPTQLGYAHESPMEHLDWDLAMVAW